MQIHHLQVPGAFLSYQGLALVSNFLDERS